MNIKDSLIRNDKSPKFYQYYPKLFSAYFDDVSEDKINKLSEAGYLYYHSTLLMDSLIDQKDFSQIPKMMLLQEEAIKTLTTIYGKNSEFWKYWEKRRNEYFMAVEIEKTLNIEDEVSKSSYENLADKKSAFGKVAIDCLYLLTEQKDYSKYCELLTSHKYFSIGFQLYDDVKDFREDLEKGQFNWAVYQLKKRVDFKNMEATILNKLLFIKGAGQEILKEAIENFQKALAITNRIESVSEGGWKHVIQETKRTIVEYLDITNGYIKTLEKRIELKKEQTQNSDFFNYSMVKNKVIKGGLDFIKHDFEENYSDLKHIMYLSEAEGFENSSQVHVTDIFQRALINDCLIQVSDKHAIEISEFLRKECQYLVNLRNNDSIGGWSYFPTVKEIAADIDDLSQIVQLFVKSHNNLLVEKYCKEAIRVALDRTFQDGSIETWIINKENQTPLQIKQEFFNETKWGKGPDLEVVANFIYSLMLYDSKVYKKHIQNALKYIMSKQSENGYWDSKWYYGNYYGTYVSLRLLKSSKKDFFNNIEKALKFIIEAQRSDGGFGLSINHSSDPLSTAFAILSLKLFLQKENPTILKAEKYLILLQNPTGYWSEVDFIKPKLQEPYKSKTLTTAFVLSALC